MINTGKIVKLRKSGDSLIFTMPKQIAEMYGMKEGSQVEIEANTTESFKVIVRVK